MKKTLVALLAGGLRLQPQHPGSQRRIRPAQDSLGQSAVRRERRWSLRAS
jgi:hypothetical protein